MILLALRPTPRRSKGVKPGESTCRVYEPTLRSVTLKTPAPVLDPSRCAPVCSFVTITEAPTITPPLESVMVPVMDPKVVWGELGMDRSNTIAKRDRASPDSRRILFGMGSLLFGC